MLTVSMSFSKLGCSVFAYDYSGYGRSTGLPREANLYADIHAAWNCLRTRWAVADVACPLPVLSFAHTDL
eukprot:m.278947 g.278947  ORF g.278947 m.278947 type:complete len:70 (+) comp19384_c0_seq20:110-319(+)